MAGDWLKIEKVTPDKPEIEAMASKLDLDPDCVFGKCFRVWRWFDDHTIDGSITGVTKAALDRKAGHTGFAAAMLSVGWLLESEAGLALPNFERHNGATAKKRADASMRQQRSRVTRSSQERVTVTRKMRAELHARDDHQCVYCGFMEGNAPAFGQYVGAVLALDHVIPVCCGGDTTPSNLVTSCSVCNNIKNGRTPEEAGFVARFVTKECDTAVTNALPREENRREDNTPPPAPPPASNGGDADVLGQAWRGVEEDLRKCGVALASNATGAARSNGVEPEDVTNVIAFWRLHLPAWDAGALYTRIVGMRPGEDCSEFWPSKSPKFEADRSRQQTSKSAAKISAERVEGEERRAQDLASGKKREAEFGSKLDAMSREKIVALVREKMPAEADFLLKRLPESGQTTGILRESLLGYFESVAKRGSVKC